MRREAPGEAVEAALARRGAAALAWLFDDALPVWSTQGRNNPAGFHDKLTADGRPTDAPLRLRVQARHVYAFAEAGRLGWPGDWRGAMDHGLSFLLDRATRPDGLVSQTFDRQGRVIEAEADLYDQGFALFAYAAAFAATRDRRALDAARGLLAGLAPFAHPFAGFREFSGPWLRANPNMHLFEAVSWWAELDAAGPWAEVADGYGRLCVDRLADPDSCALREIFTGDWRPAPAPLGACTEPGHHYEWAWLLARRPGASGRKLPLGMCERAERVGVDARTGAAVNAVDVHDVVLDAHARLWPQTERLKATVAMRAHDPELWGARACQAHDVLFSYMAGAGRGMWKDLLVPDGSFRPEPAPASSLYHITCAVSDLARETGAAQARW